MKKKATVMEGCKKINNLIIPVLFNLDGNLFLQNFTFLLLIILYPR